MQWYYRIFLINIAYLFSSLVSAVLFEYKNIEIPLLFSSSTPMNNTTCLCKSLDVIYNKLLCNDSNLGVHQWHPSFSEQE